MKHIQKLRVPALFFVLAFILNPVWVAGQEKEPAENKPEFQMTILKRIPGSLQTTMPYTLPESLRISSVTSTISRKIHGEKAENIKVIPTSHLLI